MLYKWEAKPDIYVGDNRCKRFVLGVTGKNPLICFGVNPSTADNEQADKTLHMVEQIAKRNAFDGWLMFNIYPLRCTHPECLPHARNDDLHHENLQHIDFYLQNSQNTPLTIWAAWGETITMRAYLTDCLQDIYRITSKYPCQFVAFGKEENGKIQSITRHHHPRHPSRLPSSAKWEPFDITRYLEQMKGLALS